MLHEKARNRTSTSPASIVELIAHPRKCKIWAGSKAAITKAIANALSPFHGLGIYFWPFWADLPILVMSILAFINQ
jgi:hypothetical protein